MEQIASTASVVFLLLGCFFALTGAVGVLRMPDFYSRIHPAGKTESLAQLLIVFGLLCRAPDPASAAKLILISMFLLLTAPVAAHAMTQAAHIAGMVPWRREQSGDG